MMTRLKSRLARLEAVTLPEGEPIELEVCFVKPDGTVSHSLKLKLGSDHPSQFRRRGRKRIGK
jgi:hypothetical protein